LRTPLGVGYDAYMARETLKEHIRRLGIEEFCRRYGCTKRAAESYLYDERKPAARSEVTRRLIREGRLTFEGIYGS